MATLFTNNASAAIASTISSSATSITVASGQGAEFPVLSGSDNFTATLVDTSNNIEIVQVTARSGDTMTVVRAQEGTTARGYAAGSLLELRITASVLNNFAQISGAQTLTGVKTFTSTIVGSISGNAATATTAAACSGNAATATLATNANGLLNTNWSASLTPTTNTFTGAIASTTLTVSATSVTVRLGSVISGTGVTASTQILNQLTSTGTAVASPTYSSGGAIGAYSFVVSSATSIVVGQLISGTGLASNTLVTAINGTTITLSNAFTVQAAGTYNFYSTGGVGTYTVNIAQTATSTTITQSYAKFYFVYNGNNVASIDPLGNLIVAGNITAYGTP